MSYITVQDIREEGISESEAADPRVSAIIAQQQALLERLCGQWFEARELTLTLDGNDSDTLFLPIPIISITSMTINSGVEVLDTDLYRVYNSRAIPDDRKNPRIKLVRERVRAETLLPPYPIDRHWFLKGYQNQTVVGSFGYLEPDDSTPEPIKYVLKKLVIRHLKPLGTLPAQQAGGAVLEERVDDHSIKYEGAGGARRPYMTGDPEIDAIVRFFRRPIAIGVPAPW